MRSPLPPFAALAAGCAIACAAQAQEGARLASLADLDLEQLSRVTVTSASRREQPLLEAPASVFVITAEDIRRSGATSLPEALRMAPNLQVMRGDTSQYVVSARGGLTTTANKMLVLVDGRTVYTPLFSGVFYDAIAPLLEDIERIEVISGPGGTLWGTNAVNGVINVTTRAARTTQGSLVSGVAGNHEAGISLRHGWSTGSGNAVHAYLRYYDRDERELEVGGSARDQAKRWQAGVRADGEWARWSTTLLGEVYGADVGNLAGQRDISGGNVLARLRTDLAGGSTASLQAYYDRTERVHTGTFEETRDTLDLEGQHNVRLGEGNLLSWGGVFRASRDRTIPTAALGFVPASRTLYLASLYAQDEWRLTPDLVATAGVRLERNTYTGLEWLPNVRLAYTFAPRQMAWGALSRAVRSPSRIDADLVAPGTPPFVIVNNPAFQSEIADVAELGYRGAVGASGSIALTAFHHRFRRLRTAEFAGTAITLANGAEGRVSGIEGWAELRPSADWRLIAGFTRMSNTTELEPGRMNLAEDPLGNNPRTTASVRSLWNVGPSVQLDLFARYVGKLPNPAIPSYTQLSARIGWRASRNLELSLIGQDLLGDHVEFGAASVRAVFEPGVLAKATWSF